MHLVRRIVLAALIRRIEQVNALERRRLGHGWMQLLGKLFEVTDAEEVALAHPRIGTQAFAADQLEQRLAVNSQAADRLAFIHKGKS
jgi:hypothetical protein